MAITAEKLRVEVEADTDKATRAMGNLEDQGSRIPGWAKAAGSALAGAFAVDKIVDGVRASIDAASDLQQSVGGVDAVFKTSADQVHAWAQGAAENVGLSQDAYNSLAAVIGTQLKAAGLSMDEAAGKTNDLIGLSSDLAATFGGTTADAAGALGAALRGEFDPAEKFGLALSASAVQAQAASMGFETVNGALSTHDQRLATLALIYKQTGDAQGQFSAQTNTLAEQQQIASAKVTDMTAALGTALLPAVTSVTSWIADSLVPALMDMGQWVGDNKDWLGALAVGIGAVVAVLTVWKVAQIAATAAQAALNAVMAANPIGIIVLAIGALVAALVWFFTQTDTGRRIWEDAWGAIKGAAQAVSSWFTGTLVPAVSGAWNGMVNGIRTAVEAIGAFVRGIGDRVGDVVAFFLGLPAAILGAIGDAGRWLFDSGKAILQGLIDGIKNMASKVTDAIGGVLKKARDLLPFSPAKEGPFSGKGWTLYSGRSIAEGLAEGIADRAGLVRRASLGLVEAASVPIPGVNVAGVGAGAVSGASGGSTATDALGVGSSSGLVVQFPDALALVDSDGGLITRVRVEAGKVATGVVTPLDEGMSQW